MLRSNVVLFDPNKKSAKSEDQTRISLHWPWPQNRSKEITCLDDEVQYTLRSTLILFEYKQRVSQGRVLWPKSSGNTDLEFLSGESNACDHSTSSPGSSKAIMQGSNFQLMGVDEAR